MTARLSSFPGKHTIQFWAPAAPESAGIDKTLVLDNLFQTDRFIFKNLYQIRKAIAPCRSYYYIGLAIYQKKH